MASPEALEWLDRSGVRPISPGDALAALGRLLSTKEARVVADVDWARFRDLFEAKRRTPFLDLVGPLPARDLVLDRRNCPTSWPGSLISTRPNGATGSRLRRARWPLQSDSPTPTGWIRSRGSSASEWTPSWPSR